MIRRISCVVIDKEIKMQQTSTIQIEQKKIGQLRKLSTHNILPTHNGALSHVAACVATLGFVIYSSSEKSENKESLVMKYLDSAVHFGHLLTFATWVGIQVWVHVSGFTMFKTLTRSAFAQIQSKIFPMYFMSGIIMSTISLLTHLYINPVGSWQEDRLSLYQALSISVSLLCSFLNYFYFGPETIKMVQIRAQRVKFLGIEDGVGPVSPKLVEHDLTFKEIRQRFVKMHMVCSMVNVICFGACGVNLWCLASKNNVLC